jgi:hypothetical protein
MHDLRSTRLPSSADNLQRRRRIKIPRTTSNSSSGTKVPLVSTATCYMFVRTSYEGEQNGVSSFDFSFAGFGFADPR